MTEPAPIHDPAALTRHIGTRCHARCREQSPPLAETAEKVEAAHSGDEHAPKGLAAILRRLMAHGKQEELILVPAIQRGGMPGIDDPIAIMRADHADHDREVSEIGRLTHVLTLPEGACRTWSALCAGLAAFLDDLHERIRPENEILLPQTETGGAAHV